MNIKDMSWHIKTLEKGKDGILAGNPALRDAALDVLADHKHTGLVLGIYDEENGLAGLVVFEVIEKDGKPAIVLKKQSAKDGSILSAAEDRIIGKLRDRLSETDAETADYAGRRFVKKNGSALALLLPVLLAAGLALLYMQVFENRAAGICFGIAIGIAIGMPLYRRMGRKITETREDSENAVK